MRLHNIILYEFCVIDIGAFRRELHVYSIYNTVQLQYIHFIYILVFIFCIYNKNVYL